MEDCFIRPEDNERATDDIWDTILKHSLNRSSLVLKSFDIITDLSEGKLGVGIDRAGLVSYHGLEHDSEVLKYSLGNFVQFNGGKFADDFETLEKIATASLFHDTGYYLDSKDVDFGTMKVGHERKSNNFFEGLVLDDKEFPLSREDKGYVDIMKMINTTIVSGPLKVGDLENAVNVGVMMVGAADVLYAGKNSLSSVPGLYLEFKRDYDILKSLGGMDDEMKNIPVADSVVGQIIGTKGFFDFVDNVRLKDVLPHITDRGYANNNRNKVKVISAAEGKHREKLIDMYGLKDGIERAERLL